MVYASYLVFLFAGFLLLAVVVGVPLPCSVPPLPEEAALTRVAAADCLAFVSWSGTAAADGKSTNQAERLVASPAVQALLAQLRAATLAAAAAEDRRHGGNTLEQTAALLLTAGQRPGCAFVRRMQYQPRRDLEAGVVVKLGDATAARELMGTLHRTLDAKNGAGQRHEDLAVEGVTVHALPTDLEHAFLGWLEHDGWFALVAGEAVARQVVAGLQGRDAGLSANPRWQQLATACAVARPSTRAFVDLQAMSALMEASGGAATTAVLRALGLEQATAAASCSGLEGNGFCSRTVLAVPERKGLLAACDGAPLSQDDLLPIPLDANVALACRLDVARLQSALLAAFSAMRGGDLQQAFDTVVRKQFADQFGVDLQDDLLAHLGDRVAVWNAPSQGGLLGSAATALFALRDGAKFGAAWQRLMAKVAEQAPSKAQLRERGERMSHKTCLEPFEHEGARGHWLDSHDVDFPFGLTWVAERGEFVVGLWPQTVRQVLDTLRLPSPDRSLVRLPALSQRGRAVALACTDLPSLLQQVYPLLQVLLQMSGSEWQREGFDFDVDDLPRLDALAPLLGRELTVLEPREPGWMLTRTGVLPAADPLLLTVALGLARVLADL